MVITRKVNECIVIDENIQIAVLGVEDGKVKLGITAPIDKKIYRQELYEAIKQENKEAINGNKDRLSYLLSNKTNRE